MKTKSCRISLVTKLCISHMLFTLATSSVSAAAESFRGSQILKDCPTCPEVVVIPPGSFLMGSNAINQMRGGILDRKGLSAQFLFHTYLASVVMKLRTRNSRSL